MENRPWGAPRIHGELLKLGIAVSERTVSRYLPDRRSAPSQTWRTFLTNHLGDLAWTSTLASVYGLGDDDVVDAHGVPRRHAPSLCDGPCTSNQLAVVDWPPLSNERLLAGVSRRIPFTTVDALRPARTRRRRGQSQRLPRPAGGGSFGPETPPGLQT